MIPEQRSSAPPIDGAYVYGMYLAGGRWDERRMRLAESYPKILWDPMPIVWMKPCETALIHVGNRYECPLYITSARFGVLKTTGHSSNYVLSILLSTDRPVSHWIKRGLALLCQLDNWLIQHHSLQRFLLSAICDSLSRVLVSKEMDH